MVRVLSEDTNYWLVRTYGGQYYADFVQNRYVALGWNDISDLDLIRSAASNPDDYDKLCEMAKKHLKELNKEDRQPGRIVNPIIRFVTEMKMGDIVIIPSENSTLLHFGRITSDIYLEKKETVLADEGRPSLYKRRKVEWLKWKSKDTLDPYLYRLLNSHYAVTSANDYAHYIDRTMYGFFIKGNKAHLTIEVKKKTGICGTELVELISQTLGTVDLVNSLTGENINKNCVELKLNLQSPGFIEFAGAVKDICAIALGISLLVGGKLKIKDFEFETTGLTGFVQKLYEEWNRHDLEKEKIRMQAVLARMNAHLPQELAGTDITKEINLQPVLIETSATTEKQDEAKAIEANSAEKEEK